MLDRVPKKFEEMTAEKLEQYLQNEFTVKGRRNSNKYKKLLQECSEEMKEALGKSK